MAVLMGALRVELRVSNSVQMMVEKMAKMMVGL